MLQASEVVGFQEQASEAVGLQEIICLLFNEAKEDTKELRTEKREPYFRPVTLARGPDKQQQITCFSRTISATGISLLHFRAVGPCEVVLTIPFKSCGDVCIRSQIVWSRPIGDGWYTSGARFIEFISSTGKIN